MTAIEMIRHAKEVRDRLRNPHNSVRDTEINLKIKYIEPPPEKKLLQPEPPEPLYAEPTNTKNGITIKRIFRTVSGFYRIKQRDLYGRTKLRQVTIPRQVAFYLAYKHSGLSMSAIGRLVNRDHTTIMHGCQQIEHYLTLDPILAEALKALEESLGGNHDKSAVPGECQ